MYCQMYCESLWQEATRNGRKNVVMDAMSNCRSTILKVLYFWSHVPIYYSTMYEIHTYVFLGGEPCSCHIPGERVEFLGRLTKWTT